MNLLIALLLLLPAAAKGVCRDDFFSCDDGQCIRREDWCDGKETCDDGSDEAYCAPRNWWGVSPNKCKEKMHFRCEDGLCWPLSALCDGTTDCRDSSDEDNCDSEEYITNKTDEKTEEFDEGKEIRHKDEEKLNERKDPDEEEPLKKNSEEENSELEESSEENGSDGATPTIQIPSTTTIPDDSEYYDEYNGVEVTSETSTEKNIQPFSVEEFLTTEEASLEVSSRSPTTELDFHANKMQQRYSTQINTHPTRAYRPPSERPINYYPTTRKPAVPYTGPTRPYTPRPYRYIGVQHSVQASSPYRNRYHQPPHNNYISHQSRNNYQQAYRSLNSNGRADWRPPKVYGRQIKALTRFYFKKNYNEIYRRTNYPSVRRGVDWILSIRNATGGWGKDTPRALVALSLVNNSFFTGNYENDLMQKYFQVYLGVNLLRDKSVSLNRLAMFVNALIATCQDPRDFQGWDLTELIRNAILKLHRAPKPPVINPFVYLSLCLADRNLTHYEVHHLMTYLVATRNDEVTRDMRSLALEAFACHMQKEKHNGAQFYSLQKTVWNATLKILQGRKEDGSFGSVYSTAMAAKALMSVNETAEWNPEATFRFLKNHQQRNGSFGDFLATYHVLPALSGRSLLHLRNTECNKPRVDRELSPQEILQHPGPKSYIRYSLHMGSPLATGHTVQVLVPTGINFFDIMRVAAYENNHFKFSYEEVNGKVKVYSISDIPNDVEEGLAWRLYIKSPSDNGNIPNIRELYTGDIKELLPTPEQHIIFWYHSLGF